MECKPRYLMNELENNSFRFACHKDVSCFTECCRELNLLLTPYDLLRLKRRLGMTSEELLEKHTYAQFNDKNGLPLVFLKMNDNERKTCPFVTADGCSIYEDRPGACRTYPLGRASAMTRGQRQASEKYFVVREDHCKGFEEQKQWTVQEWLDHEGLDEYNRRNDDWTGILTDSDVARLGVDDKKRSMFFISSYNLDTFRKFVFGSSLLDRFEIEPEELERMKEDDEALLQFAVKWIRYFLLGQPTLKLRNQS